MCWIIKLSISFEAAKISALVGLAPIASEILSCKWPITLVRSRDEFFAAADIPIICFSSISLSISFTLLRNIELY